MERLANQVLRDAVAANSHKLAPPSLHDNFMGFIHAIRWEEVRILNLVQPCTHSTLLPSPLLHRLPPAPATPTHTQPWIVGALVTYAMLFIVVVALRRHANLQIAFFVSICGAVYCVRYINDWARPRWAELGFTQNYFDRHGVFLSLLFSLPLMLIATFQLLYALYSSCHLVIKVKRAELAQQQKQQRKQAAAAASAGDALAADAPAASATIDTKKDQ